MRWTIGGSDRNGVAIQRSEVPLVEVGEGGIVDSATANRAIQSYRRIVPTGEKGLLDVNTKGNQ